MCGNSHSETVAELAESPLLEHYIYSSSSTASFSDQDLQEMLTSFRNCNARAEITGMLLYGEKTFLQLFEGPGPVVRNLMFRIQQDPRHQKIELLSSGPIPERLFPDWSMGFKTLPDSPLRLHAGYSSVLDQRLNNATPESMIHVPSWELLMMFREMVRPAF